MNTPALTRVDFQRLADMRLDEGKILLDTGCWSGACYLLGYAGEDGLKA